MTILGEKKTEFCGFAETYRLIKYAPFMYQIEQQKIKNGVWSKSHYMMEDEALKVWSAIH